MPTTVKIIFHMRTPMVVPATIQHLDAILSWAAVQQADFLGASNPWLAQHEMGLARHVCGDDWCFMASKVTHEWVGNAESFQYIKRSKIEDYSNEWLRGVLTKKPAFDGMRGKTKAGLYVEMSRWAKTVHAHAMVEDMARLGEILPWVTHIGKLHHHDCGAVRSFEVVEDEEASVLWQKRHLPKESPLAQDMPRAFGSLSSPYWKRENHKEIAVNVG